jgi:PKHD-type hydroxylase
MSAIVLKQFLRPQEVATVLDVAHGKLTVDETGKTAPIYGNLQRRKTRLMLPGTDAAGEAVAHLASEATKRSFLFQAAACPQAFSRPRLCCYGPQMEYRDHLDIPLIGKSQLRTDLSVTICISDASHYEGGHLVIDSDSGSVLERRWKGAAGDCLIYSSDSTHRVEQVTSGERVVIIFWVQSLVRDETRRQILFDLARGYADLEPSSREGPQAFIMRRCHDRLLRMWADE